MSDSSGQSIKMKIALHQHGEEHLHVWRPVMSGACLCYLCEAPDSPYNTEELNLIEGKQYSVDIPSWFFQNSDDDMIKMFNQNKIYYDSSSTTKIGDDE